MHTNHPVKATGTCRRLLLEEVLSVLLQAAELARAGLAEPLRGGLAGLHLGHGYFLLSANKAFAFSSGRV